MYKRILAYLSRFLCLFLIRIFKISFNIIHIYKRFSMTSHQLSVSQIRIQGFHTYQLIQKSIKINHRIVCRHITSECDYWFSIIKKLINSWKGNMTLQSLPVKIKHCFVQIYNAYLSFWFEKYTQILRVYIIKTDYILSFSKE